MKTDKRDKRFNLYVPAETHRKLKVWAAERDQPMHELIVALIDIAISEREKKAAPKPAAAWNPPPFRAPITPVAAPTPPAPVEDFEDAAPRMPNLDTLVVKKALVGDDWMVLDMSADLDCLVADGYTSIEAAIADWPTAKLPVTDSIPPGEH